MRQQLTILLLGVAISASAQLRTIKNDAFGAGEELKYVLHYGIFNAGEATLKVKKSVENASNDRPQLYVEGIGKTTGTFSWFFDAYDVYASTIDADGVFPYKFKRRVNEGGYKISQDYIFNHQLEIVRTQADTSYSVPRYTQDIMSAFYYARTLNFDTAKIGDVYRFNSFVDNEVFPIRIKYLGKSTVSIRNGKYKVLKFSPVVQEGVIFESDDDLLVYISDDHNRIPILVEAKILIGSIKMEIDSYKNLKHKLAKIK